MQLETNEIHIWQLRQDSFSLEDLKSSSLEWLSESERGRFDRYLFDKHRKQLLSARFLQRTVLSKYKQEISPAAWQFSSNEYGKPEISASQQKGGLFFNLSHSGERVVIAVSRQPDVGIDIEFASKDRRVEKIASRYFSAAETESLLALPESQRLNRFYDLWTLKEAYIKAWGMGLAIPLGDFSYCLGDDRLDIKFAETRNDRAENWQFWQLDVGEEYKLSLALRSERQDFSIEKLELWGMSKLEAERELQPVILRSKTTNRSKSES